MESTAGVMTVGYFGRMDNEDTPSSGSHSSGTRSSHPSAQSDPQRPAASSSGTVAGPGPGSTTADAAAVGLSRTLSHRQMAMIAMGSALGTGLFLGSGQAIAVAGPAVIISFAIGSAIAATIALTMGEMASRYPVRGGFGTLAARFLSPFWGYLVRWLYWFVTLCVTGAELVACATYLQYWFPQVHLGWGILVFAVAVIAVNLYSVNSFGVIEFFLSSIKVIAVLAFIIVGLFFVFVGTGSHPAPGLQNWTNDGGFLPNGIGAVWLAMSIVMFSFGGIELLSVSAAEAKNPARSIRVAAQTTIVRLAFFYVMAIGIVVALVPWQSAAQADGVEQSPFVRVFDYAGIPGAASITNFVVLIAALSAANANLYASSRMMHSLSVDRLGPAFARYTTRRNVPLAAMSLTIVFIVAVAILAATGVGNIFGLLMAIVVFSVTLVWALILVTYIAYRPTRDGLETFHAPGGTVMAVLGLIGLVFVFSTVVAVESMTLAAMLGVPAVALMAIAYAAVFRRRVDAAEIDESFVEAEQARTLTD